MAYVEHEWVNGETITAAKMNNIEEGIAEASQSGGGGGYDAVVYVYHENNSSSDYEVTIESGDYASLLAKLNDNQPPIILLKVWDELGGIHSSTSMTVVYGGDSSFISFLSWVPNISDISRSVLNWNSNDTIEFYWYQ